MLRRWFLNSYDKMKDSDFYIQAAGCVMEKYSFGVDIGGTAVKVGLFDRQGTLVEHWQIPTRLQEHGALILSDVTAAAEGCLDTHDLSWKNVSDIGIAVPGPVLDEGFVPLAVNLGWRDVDVRRKMQELTGIRNVCVENDAKAAALGEYRMGGWEQYKSAVMVTIGTAIGGAVILDGKVLHGAFGAAGELSHVQVNPEEAEPCACGKFGHLQQYVSTEAILKDIRKKLDAQACESRLRGCEHLSVKDVFDAAKAGDGPALETVRRTVRMLARMLAAVSCVVDPELYLIGGGISKAGDFLLEMIRTEFKALALTTSENARIEAARMGNDAGIYGAMLLAAGNRKEDNR